MAGILYLLAKQEDLLGITEREPARLGWHEAPPLRGQQRLAPAAWAACWAVSV